MLGRTHVTTGATGAAWAALPLVACGVPLGIAVLSIPVGAYAALLPDLDHPKSRIAWMLPPISNLASWVLRGGPWEFSWPVFGRRVYGGRVFPWEVRHRGVTHREEAAVVFGLVLGLPLWLITGWWWVFALQIMIGCLTHLWGDMRTTGGLQHRRDPRRRRTIGRTFDTGSDYEEWARRIIYRPTAIGSVAGSVILMTYVT